MSMSNAGGFVSDISVSDASGFVSDMSVSKVSGFLSDQGCAGPGDGGAGARWGQKVA